MPPKPGMVMLGMVGLGVGVLPMLGSMTSLGLLVGAGVAVTGTVVLGGSVGAGACTEQPVSRRVASMQTRPVNRNRCVIKQLSFDAYCHTFTSYVSSTIYPVQGLLSRLEDWQKYT